MEAQFKRRDILMVTLSYLSIACIAFGLGLITFEMRHSQKRLAMEVEYGQWKSEVTLAGLAGKLRSDLAVEDFQFPLERLTESVAYKNLDHQLQEYSKVLQAHERFQLDHSRELGRVGMMGLVVGLACSIATSVSLQWRFSPGDRLMWSFGKRMQEQAVREACPPDKPI